MRRVPLPHLALAAVLIAATFAVPATAVAAESPTEVVEVEGVMRVVLDEPGHVQQEVDAEGRVISSDTSEPPPGKVALVTAGGEIPLDADADIGLGTGERAVAAIEVEAEVAAGVPADATPAEAGVAIAEGFADTDAPAAVVQEIDPVEAAPDSGVNGPVLGLAAPMAHTVDVVVVAPTGASPAAVATDGAIDTMLARVAAFWNEQSNGQVTAITRSTTIFRLTNAGACDPYTVWPAAAAAHGRTAASYETVGAARHLLVIAHPQCNPGNGLGSFTTDIHDGGLIWAVAATDFPRSEHTISHEFGHNFSLDHSNLHSCPNPVIEGAATVGGFSDGCSDQEYGDYYDVMAGGFTIVRFDSACGCNVVVVDTSIPAALNVTQRRHLDAYPAGSFTRTLLPAAVDFQASTVVLSAVSAGAGLRGAEFVDPKTGQSYYVEYRNGAGRDATSWYANYGLADPDGEFGTGVRVLKVRPPGFGPAWNGPSVALRPALSVGHTVRHRAMDVGQSLSSRGNGFSVNVTAINGTTATVQVSLRRAEQFTSAPLPTISGPARFDGLLTAASGTWSPAPTSLTYEWLRNGAPIDGAIGTTYRVGLADKGATLSVRVVARRTGFSATTRTSAATAVVTGPTVARIAGGDRYSTAVAVAEASYPGQVPVVYVASGAAFPDALAAGPAAVQRGGPLLLTAPGALPDPVRAVLENRLRPAQIVVVGGPGAVSDSVVAALESLTFAPTVTRVSGADRFDTSRRIAKAFSAPVNAVYVASGLNFPDALSASAVGAGTDRPVLLVNGAAATLDAATRTELQRLQPSRVIVVGGTGAVSAGIMTGIQQAGFTVQRLSGPDRYETSRVINSEAYPSGSPMPAAYLATGLGFPDALAGSALAGLKSAPLYLVEPTCVPPGVTDLIGVNGTQTVTLLGGTSVLTATTAALTRC